MSDNSPSAALPLAAEQREYPKRKSVFIEKVMPVKLLDREVYGPMSLAAE